MADFQVVNTLDKKFGTTDEIRSLLRTHLHTPDKVEIYYDALRKCIVDSRFVFTATWSWWAFFGGAFFFFYRKMTKPGLLLLGLTVFLWFVPIPLIDTLVNIGCAISAKYLYCKKFVGDLDTAGYPDRSAEEMYRVLGNLGGYNGWAIWAGVLCYALALVVKILIAAAIVSTLGVFSLLYSFV